MSLALSTSLSYSQCEAVPFALLELFSSEGCSSCPPADEQFNKLYREMRGENLLMVAHHVDYWNDALPGPCGTSAWKDPYSKPGSTLSQREYKEALGGQHLVTPQWVVRGRRATFINLEDLDQAKKLLKSNLKRTPKVGVCLAMTQLDTGLHTVTFSYQVSGSSNNGSEALVCILIEDDLLSEVTAGENCKKTLRHDAVRRTYRRKIINNQMDESGVLTISLPKNLRPEKAGVLAYVQDVKTREAIGGNRGFRLVE